MKWFSDQNIEFQQPLLWSSLLYWNSCMQMIDWWGNFKLWCNILPSHSHDLVAGDCLDHSCSGHGTCSQGVCYCDLGWRGDSCSERNHMIEPCLPNCNRHGSYDPHAGHCRWFIIWNRKYIIIFRSEYKYLIFKIMLQKTIFKMLLFSLIFIIIFAWI